MSKRTPGPFLIGHDRNILGESSIYHRDGDFIAWCGRRYDIVDLLNKGTHFDRLLEAAKLARQTMANVPLPDGDGIDDNHPAMRQINAAIAECEARTENDIPRTSVPGAPHPGKNDAGSGA